ncbi:MAG: S24 family peptidase [Desulfobacteraceae bacterium]|jgi:signal peptidase I
MKSEEFQNQGKKFDADDEALILPSSVSSNHLLLDLSTELLGRGKRVRFRAPGRSMYPTIRENEAITVEPIKPRHVKVGDIILFRSGESVVAHRVMRIERGKGETLRFILREDTLGTLDQPVAAKQILGKVVSVERAGRNIDPYSIRAKVRLLIHTIGSHLKR